MLAVATAPMSGAAFGGAGQLSLWSWNRPFMALSVVNGHTEGAVTDFVWLDTPKPEERDDANDYLYDGMDDMEEMTRDLGEVKINDGRGLGVWQHLLSVGRDGRCLIQSLAKGERPINNISPTCFALSNKSPFQKGFGSLQMFSVCQPVPTGPANEFRLTGLRQDALTASAPSVFRENPILMDAVSSVWDEEESKISLSDPWQSPALTFNVIDACVKDTFEAANRNTIVVAPEVLHISRFAKRYKYVVSEGYATRASLCQFNATVATNLRLPQVADMWDLVAHLLEDSRMEDLPDPSQTTDSALDFLVLPTIQAILEERSEAGDIQTCVTLCEVLRVVSKEGDVKVPGIEIERIREWYLSYIDLLREMCLFIQATELIKNCHDPYISAINKQSTM